MKYYIVLAQYIKTGKKIWWFSSVQWEWQAGQKVFLPGTTTEVKILNVIEASKETVETTTNNYCD